MGQCSCLRHRSDHSSELRHIASAKGAPDKSERAQTAVRPVCFDAEDGFVDTAVYWRESLLAGDTVEGPAIIEEFGSTFPLHPGFTARIDASGNIITTRSNRQETGK